MSLELNLNQIILHSLCLDQGEGLGCQMRDKELSGSSAVQALMSSLHETYQSKSSKGFGFFSSDESSPTEFREKLQTFLGDSGDFVTFSQQAAQLLVNELSKYDFAEEGILLFSKYQWVTSDYLMVALLSNCESMSVDEALEINNSRHLDLGRLQLAAQIDLSLWQADPESNRYISFIKGRAGRKVADFFLDFLGCGVGLDSKAQNQGLMQAVDDYCANQSMDLATKQAYRENVYQYCQEQIEQGEEILVETLSQQLAPQVDQAEGSFYDFVRQDYELEEAFPPNRATLRKLTKYVGSGGGMRISFDQKHLGERVQYDAQTDTLTIQGLPPNLRAQLRGSN